MQASIPFPNQRTEWTEHEIEIYIKSPMGAWNSALALYRMQTAEEMEKHASLARNGVGFSKIDAPLVTPIIQGGLERGWIYYREAYYLRKKLEKYTRQLTIIANIKLHERKTRQM